MEKHHARPSETVAAWCWGDVGRVRRRRTSIPRTLQWNEGIVTIAIKLTWCAIDEWKFVFDALSLVFYSTKLRGSSTRWLRLPLSRLGKARTSSAFLSLLHRLHGVSYWKRVSDPLRVFDAYRPPSPFRVKMWIFIFLSCCIKHTVLQVTLKIQFFLAKLVLTRVRDNELSKIVV